MLIVDNMSTKDLVQYVFDDLLNMLIDQPEFLRRSIKKILGRCFDDVVKDIKEYANKKTTKINLKKPY